MVNMHFSIIDKIEGIFLIIGIRLDIKFIFYDLFVSKRLLILRLLTLNLLI